MIYLLTTIGFPPVALAGKIVHDYKTNFIHGKKPRTKQYKTQYTQNIKQNIQSKKTKMY